MESGGRLVSLCKKKNFRVFFSMKKKMLKRLIGYFSLVTFQCSDCICCVIGSAGMRVMQMLCIMQLGFCAKNSEVRRRSQNSAKKFSLFQFQTVPKSDRRKMCMYFVYHSDFFSDFYTFLLFKLDYLY